MLDLENLFCEREKNARVETLRQVKKWKCLRVRRFYFSLFKKQKPRSIQKKLLSLYGCFSLGFLPSKPVIRTGER